MHNDPSEVEAPGTGKELVLGFRRNVVVLSATSFLTDASNNMIFPLMALFLDNVLGVQPAIIGLVEGAVESAASLLKMLSGWLSDRLGERRRLVVGGYWASTAAKAFLVAAASWLAVLLLRFVDRIGKGLRAAPAQALVADESQEGQLGRTFGFYKMMDVGGGLVGLVAAAGIIFLVQGERLLLAWRTYQVLVLAALAPALLGAFLVTLFLKERVPARAASTPLLPADWKGLGVRFGLFLGIIVVFGLGNFSNAFLALRAQDLGASALHIVLLLAASSLVYSLVSWPAGLLSDRWGRQQVLTGGWLLYAVVAAGFAVAGSTWQILGLYLLYGIYLGATKGVERAFVADLVPASGQRGAAYGLYNAAVGLVALPASAIAGLLWQTFTPAAPFLFGAALALLAVLLLRISLR